MIQHPAQLIVETQSAPRVLRSHLVACGPFGSHPDAAKWLGPITFFVPGEPRSQRRPVPVAMPATHGVRCRCGRKWSARLRDPKDGEEGGCQAWKDLVAVVGRSAQPERPLVGPVWLAVSAFFHAPKYVQEWGVALPCLKPVKPDSDNLFKPVADAMTKAGWWFDDGQVVCPFAPKYWVSPEQREGVKVEVFYLEQPRIEPGLFGSNTERNS